MERRRRARLRRGPDGADAVVVRPAGPVQGRHHDLRFHRLFRRRTPARDFAGQRLRPNERGSGVVLGPGMLVSALHLDVTIAAFPGLSLARLIAGSAELS